MATAKKLSQKSSLPASATSKSNVQRSNGKSAKSRSSEASPSRAKSALAVAKPAEPKLRAAKAAAKATTAKPKAVKPAKPSSSVKSAKPSSEAAAVTDSAAPKPAKVGKLAKPQPEVRIEKIAEAGGITTDAVARRTGKGWGEWFALLDGAGARDLDHKGIVAVLAQRHGVGPWWQQMITVAYEQYRGKRNKHETPDGYQVGASRTVHAPLRKLFKMWVEAEERRKWLADDRFSISKATAGKSIRARWGRGSSRIDVYFYDKGDGKSQVAVQHNQIDSQEAAEQMKAYWGKKLGALEEALGG